MSLDFNKKYFLGNGFEIMEKEDNYIYINYKTTNWLRTNSTGSEILSLCDGELSLEQSIDIISKKYGFSNSIIKQNSVEFLNTAIERSILVEEFDGEIVYDIKLPDFPSDIWIHVTEKCNLNCPFCYSASGKNKSVELDIKSVLDFLQQIPIEQRKNILISGGEPFLYKGLTELIKSLNEMKFEQITIITNGTVGEEVYKDVLPYITNLQISLDGTTKDVYEKSRGVGYFDTVVDKFRLAREIGINNLVASFTPTKYNIDDLPNLPKFAYENDIDCIHITRLVPVGRGKTSIDSIAADAISYSKSLNELLEKTREINSKVFYEREIDQVFVQESEKQKYLRLSISADQSQKIILGGKRKSCGLSSLISIAPDGNVYICPSLSVNQFLLGNISDDKYETIVNKNKVFAERLCVDNLSETCRSCKLKYFCGGGCRACALATGDICGMDSACEFYKESIMEVMWEYKTLPTTVI